MNIQSIGSSAAVMPEKALSTPSIAPNTRQPPAKPSVNEQSAIPKQAIKASQTEVETAVKAMNDFVGHLNDNLQFSIDADSGQTVVKVIDSTTKEVIKQFPSEEMIAISKAMDQLKGLLVQQKA